MKNISIIGIYNSRLYINQAGDIKKIISVEISSAAKELDS